LTPVRAYLSWLRGQVAKLQDQGVQIDAIVEATDSASRTYKGSFPMGSATRPRLKQPEGR
ncbi:hypothetical protein SAMN07250955_1151, partial [Arboricoccus pini]